jgi:hypothetical protein
MLSNAGKTPDAAPTVSAPVSRPSTVAPAAQILALQRTIGNRGVAALLQRAPVRPTANYGDVAQYRKQGRAIYDPLTGARISEHEHVGARVNWEIQTTDPSGATAYGATQYRASHTATIPYDMARIKTDMDMAVRDDLKAAGPGGASKALADEARPIESDAARTIQARGMAISARKSAGLPVDDLLAVTDAKIHESVHLQGSQLHEAGRAQASAAMQGGSDASFAAELDQALETIGDGGKSAAGEVPIPAGGASTVSNAAAALDVGLAAQARAMGAAAIGGLGKAASVVGAAGAGWQTGKGIEGLIEGRGGAGIDLAEGAANLGLSVGAPWAVHTGALTAETGAAAGGTALLAGLAAGGSVALAAETARAAREGRDTPVDIADKYYGTHLGDLGHYVDKAADALPKPLEDAYHEADDAVHDFYRRLTK